MDQILYFWNNYDFNRVMGVVGDAMRDPMALAMNPWIMAPTIIILGLLASKRTSGLGQKLVIAVPAGVYLFVTLTVLHNDKISNPGPFMMALGGMFIVVGWFIYDRLMRS